MADKPEAEIPADLLEMRRKVESGIDADDVPGIERLWLWQFDQHKEELFKSQSEFIAEYRRRLAAGEISQ